MDAKTRRLFRKKNSERLALLIRKYDGTISAEEIARIDVLNGELEEMERPDIEASIRRLDEMAGRCLHRGNLK